MGWVQHVLVGHRAFIFSLQHLNDIKTIHVMAGL